MFSDPSPFFDIITFSNGKVQWIRLRNHAVDLNNLLVYSVILYPDAEDFYLYLAVNHMHPGNTGYDYRVPDQEPRNGHSSHRSGEATSCLKVSLFFFISI